MPAEYTGCGRFWGVAGVRGVVAATTFFPRVYAKCERPSRIRRKIDENIGKILADGVGVVLKSEPGVLIIRVLDEKRMIRVRQAIRWLDLAVHDESAQPDYLEWLLQDAEVME